MLPTIDMSEPMQEAIPALVVGSDLAQVWSCCTTLPMTSLTDAFLSFSGAPPFVLVNMSTSRFRRYEDAIRESGRFFDAAPTYHLLSAAALNSSRNRNFVHMKGELSGVVGPVFVVADPIGSGFVASLARPGGRRCWRRSLLPWKSRYRRLKRRRRELSAR
jgi:hypothetical protein